MQEAKGQQADKEKNLVTISEAIKLVNVAMNERVGDFIKDKLGIRIQIRE